MQIRIATYEDKESWDQYVYKHLDGNAYQFFSWKEAIESSYKFKGLYLMAENESSNICGVLPLIDFKTPLIGSKLISLPYCDTGGVLADNQNIENALIENAHSISRHSKGSLYIRSPKPLSAFAQNQTDKVSMILELPNSSEELLSNFKSKFRLKVKKPARDGFVAVLGKAELIDDFYVVFSQNMRDLGSPVHARLWLRSIVSAYEDKVRVAVVYAPDKSPVSAGIILLHPRKVSNPWASSLRQYNNMRPNMLLYWTLLAFAADNGFKQFDFGRSTPGEGTYSFKQQWGAEPKQLYWYKSTGFHAVDGCVPRGGVKKSNKRFGKRELAASLWSMLPQSGADWFGPKLRKYISL